MSDRITSLNPAQWGAEDTRRIYDRFPSRLPAKFKDTRDNFGINVYLRDASAAGVKITTKEHLYLNDRVALEIEMTDGKDPLQIRGEVIWVKKKDAGLWDVGVKFHKVVLMDFWRLCTFAETNALK